MSRRHVQSFPAFTDGPSSFYEARTLLTPEARTKHTTPLAFPRFVRRRNLCVAMPQVDAARVYAANDAQPRNDDPLASPIAYGPPGLSEHPVIVGLMVALFPPMGVVMLWGSRRFSMAGKIAVTAFSAFAALSALIAVVALVR